MRYKGNFEYKNVPEGKRREEIAKIFSVYRNRRVSLFLSNFSQIRGDIGDGNAYTQKLLNVEYWNHITMKWEKAEDTDVYNKLIMKISFINGEE